MGFVISQCSLMDDRSLPVIRIKYKEGHKWLGHKRRLIEVICVNPINASWIPAKAEAMEGNTAV